MSHHLIQKEWNYIKIVGFLPQLSKYLDCQKPLTFWHEVNISTELPQKPLKTSANKVYIILGSRNQPSDSANAALKFLIPKVL